MKRFLSVAALAAMLAGCGGGGGGVHTASTGGSSALPTLPTTPIGGVAVAGDPRGTATVQAHATISTNAIPQWYNRATPAAQRTTASRLRAQASSIASVEVDGTLYQGSVSAVPVTSVQSLPISANGTVTVSQTFTNVVPAANDWVVFNFFAVGSDGSKSAIGTLGTLVNVASGTTSANLSAASTQVLQVAGGLMANAEISTYDIENNANLAGDLATKIAGTGITPDATLLIYSTSQLVQLDTALATAYERDLTLTASSAAEFSVVYDYTQNDENDLNYNAVTFAHAYDLTGVSQNVESTARRGAQAQGGSAPSTSVIGGPPGVQCCSTPAGVPMHAPSAGYFHAQPQTVPGFLYVAASGSITLRNVYGGHIIVGSHNGVDVTLGIARRSGASSVRSAQDITTQAYGTSLAMAGMAPGTASKTLTLANTTVTTTIIDTQANLFSQGVGFQEVGYFQFAVLPGANALGNVPYYETQCFGNCTGNFGLFQYANQNALALLSPPDPNGVVTATYDSWNSYGLPPSQIQICSFTNCVASQTATTPINVTGAFDDPGTNVAGFGWAPGGGDATQSITTGCCSGYLVTFAIPGNNSAAVTGTLTGTVPSTVTAYVPARAILDINTDIPANSTMSITFTDSNGNSYPETLVPYNEQATSSIATGFAVASFKMTYTIPASAVQNLGNPATTGQFTINNLFVNGQYSTNSGCC